MFAPVFLQDERSFMIFQGAFKIHLGLRRFHSRFYLGKTDISKVVRRIEYLVKKDYESLRNNTGYLFNQSDNKKISKVNIEGNVIVKTFSPFKSDKSWPF